MLCFFSDRVSHRLSDNKLNLHLLYEVDIIEEEFDAQKKVKRHISPPFLRVLLPSLGGHFRQFGIKIDKEKLVVCVQRINGCDDLHYPFNLSR